MTPDGFGLSDIRFYAYHGAADHERDVGQWCSVDIPDALLERFAVETARVRIHTFRSPAPGVPGTTGELVRSRKAAA